MTNSRKSKLEFLDKAFNRGDLSGLENAPTGISGSFYAQYDDGERRHECNYLGYPHKVWNWTDKEIESFKIEMDKKYELLWLINYDLNEEEQRIYNKLNNIQDEPRI